MQQTTVKLIKEQISYPQLPLALYREIVAHVQQLPGVSGSLIPQHSSHFDYQQSQVDSLLIEYPSDINNREKQQLEAILNYYAQRYGSYQRQSLDN